MSDSLAGVLAAMGGLAIAGDDAARVDQIRALEELKAAAAAAQARVTARFVASQRAAQREASEPTTHRARTITRLTAGTHRS